MTDGLPIIPEFVGRDFQRMSYQSWLEYRDYIFNSRSSPSFFNGRLDLELSYPNHELNDVPVPFNPHIGGFAAHDCFYDWRGWKVVSDIVVMDDSPHDVSLRVIVEASDNGEIRLMSTASSIIHEWWAARRNWNDFAQFDGFFWRITWNEFFGPWPGGQPWPPFMTPDVRNRLLARNPPRRNIQIFDGFELGPLNFFPSPADRAAHHAAWNNQPIEPRTPVDWEREGF